MIRTASTKGIILVIALYGMATLHAAAQKSTWQWAHSATDGPQESSDILPGGRIATDSAGNLFTTTQFEGHLTIDTFNFQSKGERDLLLIKYNKLGKLLWAKQIGGRLDDGNFHVGVQSDAQGFSYICGSFHDTVDFGGQSLISRDTLANNSITPNSAMKDGFVAKYAPNGSLVWVSQIGGRFFDAAYDLKLDGLGHLFVTGEFGGFETIPPIHAACTFDTITKNAPGEASTFIAKYDTSGHIIWVKAAGYVESCTPQSLALDNHNNIFVSGYFVDNADFDSFRVSSMSNKVFGADIFVAKYDSNGTALWAKSISGDHSTFGGYLSVSSSGYAYITGEMGSTVTKFGNTATLPGLVDIFNCYIAKFAPNGTLVWAKNAGIDPYDDNRGNAISIDKASNIYVTGDFDGIAYFPDTLYGYGGSHNAFVAKFDSSGTYKWANFGGGDGGGSGMGILCNDASEIFVSGYYNGSYGKFGSKTLPATDYVDMFFAKLSSSTGVADLPFNAYSASVSPNPSFGDFTVRWVKGSFVQVTITNALGAVVATVALPSSGANEVHLSLPSLAEGLYFIELRGETGVMSTKLVIRH